ncbi:pyruvate formate-lyase-activating protein [Clostridium sediminicola]|uniref:pyruvate formate-lyase-activating protein n=1 Tax=Clostridium sediminicola TaxID=3114879 RepID=UPI0031F26C03
MIKGRIHSFESMGLLDGPGIRNVIFLQGCPLRCLFCHNPDTWNFSKGQSIEPHDLLRKILKYKPYFGNNGGVTFSGGEPLMQPEFLLQCLKLCKENNIHTAIDTSGCGAANYSEILKYSDLVLLDIKHVDSKNFELLTGVNKSKLDNFINELNKSSSRVWARHVIIPSMTDSEEHIKKLAKIINTIKNIDKVELLPYHTMGNFKYEKLSLKYPLENIPAMDKDKCKSLENKLKTLVNL